MACARYGSPLRSDFAAGGVAALKASIAPGPPPMKSETALRVPPPCWKNLWPTGATGRSPPSRRDRSARGRAHQPFATVQGLEKKKFRWRRPRHTLKGRQTESEVERVGLRLQLRKQQAEAGDIILLYGDGSEALTHPYLARAWAKSGADLRVPAPGQAKKVAMLGRSITSRANSSSIPARPSAARFHRPSGATRPSLWTAARATGQASRAGRGQWSDPHQQTLAHRPGRSRTLAHRRVAAEIAPNSTTSSRSGAISRPITSPTRLSPTPTRSTRPSITPSSISTVSASPIRWPSRQFLCHEIAKLEQVGPRRHHFHP